MTSHTSEFIGDGWSAMVMASGGTVEVRILLAGVAVPGLAVLTLPLAQAGAALSAIVSILYADELLFSEAVRIHLLQCGSAPRKKSCEQVMMPTAHTTRTTRTRSLACTPRRR